MHNIVRDYDSKLALLMNLRKTTRGKFTRIRNRIMNVLESDPDLREIKELVEDLKETEPKLESICCDIQTCLTSLQDQARLDQLDEWLAKLTEDSLEVRAEAVKYLEESSSRSSSSSSHKNTRSYQRKPGDVKDTAFKQNFQWQNVLGMELRMTDTLPRESDVCREENKSRVRVDTSRKEDIEKWINSSGNHSDPR